MDWFTDAEIAAMFGLTEEQHADSVAGPHLHDLGKLGEETVLRLISPPGST